MKRGQVAVVSAVMILILVILAILLYGLVYVDGTVISVKDTSSVGTFYVLKHSGSDSVENQQFLSGDCCNTYTFVNYHTRQVIPRSDVSMDGMYYVPSCNNCAPKVYTAYYDNHEVEVVPDHSENVFYVKTCNDCGVHTYTRYDEANHVESTSDSYDSFYHVNDCFW